MDGVHRDRCRFETISYMRERTTCAVHLLSGAVAKQEIENSRGNNAPDASLPWIMSLDPSGSDFLMVHFSQDRPS